jgi:hypothetical protein
VWGGGRKKEERRKRMKNSVHELAAVYFGIILHTHETAFLVRVESPSQFVQHWAMPWVAGQRSVGRGE